MALEETYEILSLLSQYGVEYVWSGHQHSRQSVAFKGVQYMVLDATQDSEKGQAYMTVQMGENVNYLYHNYPAQP
jgi:DNA repair exonuclease SbcCD nuclease subunit